MFYFIYIIKSFKDGKIYTGMSHDPDSRLIYHNSGRVKSTKYRRPFILIYKEKYDSRAEAREREKYLKSYKGSKDKFILIENI